MTGVISGYGIHFRQLREVDVNTWSLDLKGHPITECIAVDGSDLADCLAAVVHVPTGTLLWSEVPTVNDESEEYEVHPINDQAFSAAVLTVAKAVLPACFE